MTTVDLLPHGFIKRYRAGYGYIQGMDHTHLRDHEETIAMCSHGITHSVFLVTENEGHVSGEVGGKNRGNAFSDKCTQQQIIL